MRHHLRLLRGRIAVWLCRYMVEHRWVSGPWVSLGSETFFTKEEIEKSGNAVKVYLDYRFADWYHRPAFSVNPIWFGAPNK